MDNAEPTAPTDTFRFFRTWLTRPVLTGAVSPSGRQLSRAMAAEADPSLGLPVLELGPGTGVVTRALIERGFAPEQIVAVEYNEDFASLLVERFRGLNVVQGDAFDLDATLPPGLAGPYCAVVSSLPLLNSPEEDRPGLIEGALARVVPAGGVVQFSYGVKPPSPEHEGRFSVERRAFILWNLPPARVWLYRSAAQT